MEFLRNNSIWEKGIVTRPEDSPLPHPRKVEVGVTSGALPTFSIRRLSQCPWPLEIFLAVEISCSLSSQTWLLQSHCSSSPLASTVHKGISLTWGDIWLWRKEPVLYSQAGYAIPSSSTAWLWLSVNCFPSLGLQFFICRRGNVIHLQACEHVCGLTEQVGHVPRHHKVGAWKVFIVVLYSLSHCCFVWIGVMQNWKACGCSWEQRLCRLPLWHHPHSSQVLV